MKKFIQQKRRISSAGYWKAKESVRIQKLKEKINELQNENVNLKSEVHINAILDIGDTREEILRQKKDNRTFLDGTRKGIYFEYQGFSNLLLKR